MIAWQQYNDKIKQQATQISQTPNDRAMGTPLKLGVREFSKG
jgi:hypothetical protein